MLATFLSFLTAFLTKLIVDWSASVRSDDALKDVGRKEGETELAKTVAETADAQAQNNAIDRSDGARGVLERLRRASGGAGNEDRR